MFKKISLGIIVILLVLISFIFISFEIEKGKQYSTYDFEISENVEKADIELGKRIYEVRAGCIECHGKNLAGVMIMDDGGMGTIQGANITSYNLKDWSDKEVAKAIRYGVHKSGRSLMFMPSFDFQSMSKNDIASIIKYIRSQPEVIQEKSENKFGPVAKILSILGKIPILFPAKSMNLSKGFESKPEEKTSIEFGEYLANSCIGCHGHEFRGGPIEGGAPDWPEASNIRLGADLNYNLTSFRKMIESGKSPSTNKELRPPMPIKLLKQLNPTEIDSLWLFLSSLK